MFSIKRTGKIQVFYEILVEYKSILQHHNHTYSLLKEEY